MGISTGYCAITNLPILKNDRCVVIFTFENDEGVFIPETIFYRGTYNGYGNIEYDKDCNYLNFLTDKVKNLCYKMFILEEAYDSILNISINRFCSKISNDSAYNEGYISKYSLELIGFKLQNSKSKNQRYSAIYKHPLEPAKEVWTDGRWSIAVINNNEFDLSSWKDFQTFFPKIDYIILHQYSFLLLDIKEFANDLIYKESIYKNLDCTYLFESYKDSLSKNEQIHLKMFSFLNEKELLKELVNIRKIQRFMYCVGLKFGVSRGGPQEGFLEANIKLFEITKKSFIDKLNKVKFNGDYSSIG